MRFLDRRRRVELQGKSVNRRQIMARAPLQDDDVPWRRGVLDVLRGVETGGDFQAENVDVETAAAFNTVALQRAVGKGLWHVATGRKLFRCNGVLPVASGVRAAVQRAAGIVILDL